MSKLGLVNSQKWFKDLANTYYWGLNNQGMIINSFPSKTESIVDLNKGDIITLYFDLRNGSDTLYFYVNNRRLRYKFKDITLGGQIAIYFGLSIY